ncbi:MAG: M23 family metallopeptidase [Polyangiales bacterium]
MAEIPLQLPFEGKARAGAVYVGKTEPGVRLRLGRRRLRVGEEGHFLFAFGPYAKGVYRLKMRAKDRAQETEMTVAKRQYGEEAIDGLPEDEVDLDKGTKKELRQWRRKISKARRISRLKPDWASLNAGFRLPLKGRVTGVYGTRRTLNGKKNQRHWGIDLAARVGKKVRAPAPGVVVFAAKDIPLSGSLVIVDHGHGLSSSFLHLSRIQVREGQTLRTGQILGRVGSTGRATGAHLDWRMNWRGLRVDPVSLLNPKALSYLKRHGLAEEP